MTRTVAIIQARVESSRLYGKVLEDIRGTPMIERVIDRVRAAGVAEDIVLCIPDTGANDPLRGVARRKDCRLAFQYPCATGEAKNDLLGAYVTAAERYKADVVLRVTGDCPLVCPDVIAEVAACWQPDTDYCSNVIERTWPRGLDAELISTVALERLLRTSEYWPDMEHVTLSFRMHPERWQTMSVVNSADHAELNWSVDDSDDLLRVRRLYGELSDPLAPYPELFRAWEALCV